MYKILVLGSQGSGKGTQADLLSEYFDIPALSMGQLLRDEIATGSELGQKIDGILKGGNLASTQDVAEVLKRRIGKEDAKNGYVLDGYPRSMDQFNSFDFDEPTHFILIDVPVEECVNRLGGRLTCNKCGKVYRIVDGYNNGDKCSACSGELGKRHDESEEALRRRLEIYEKDTKPVFDEYKKKGIFHLVDGAGTIEEVFGRVLNAL
ncbi:MAG: nucleoside monophosphate kinase [Patescibacteria group bacterium]